MLGLNVAINLQSCISGPDVRVCLLQVLSQDTAAQVGTTRLRDMYSARNTVDILTSIPSGSTQEEQPGSPTMLHSPVPVSPAAGHGLHGEHKTGTLPAGSSLSCVPGQPSVAVGSRSW
jgi:hypothetical protein